MGDALGWARLFVAILATAANLAVTVWFFSFIMGAVGKASGMLDNPVLHRYSSSPKMLVRRMWCKHVQVIRGRDPHGRLYTACARCAKDVNAGKERWEWR